MPKHNLRPCPFCGGFGYVHAIRYSSAPEEYTIGAWHDDGCYLKNAFPTFETKQEAIDAWNRRSTDE